ncbi:uncharacterized protein LOC121424092 [Lytechinus variegatus]|uniref:uncharacterized protein LOC121424092 n=1 Tax=Lytechinus variegatus TaxID=7654 RepID=UPI001BB24943|nr:uncharacterized protein LOC121424092 [Lytechinus variegatus]
MAEMKVWTVLLVLISFHGNSDSQTDMFTMIMTTDMGTPPPTNSTPPPPPPPSITPPPPRTSTPDPPITTPTPPPPPTITPPPPPPSSTPEPPVTRTPPPPPPPSPPPPPPSSTIPPSTTPSPTTMTTPTRMSLTTTVAMTTQPIERTLQTTRQRTEPPASVEPNPVAESLGKIGVLLATSLDEFNRAQFKEVIAREVNNYCSEFTGQCLGEGKTVSAINVVIVNAEPYEVQVNDARRRLLQEQEILVEYYVQDPVLSTNVMMTTEQQRSFLANDDVDDALKTDITGYTGIAPVYADPVDDEGLEGWEIALIVIGSGAAAGLVVGGIYYLNYTKKSKSDELDVELQEKKSNLTEQQTGNDYSTVVTTNGLDQPKKETKKKPPVDEANVATQVKYKDILIETGYEAVEGNTPKEANKIDERPNGGTSVVVTAEISSSSSGSSTPSDTEQDATAEDKQEIPPDYEPPPPIANDKDNEDQLAKKEEDEAVNELDKLIDSQAQELTVNSVEFQNPGFDASPEN